VLPFAHPAAGDPLARGHPIRRNRLSRRRLPVHHGLGRQGCQVRTARPAGARQLAQRWRQACGYVASAARATAQVPHLGHKSLPARRSPWRTVARRPQAWCDRHHRGCAGPSARRLERRPCRGPRRPRPSPPLLNPTARDTVRRLPEVLPVGSREGGARVGKKVGDVQSYGYSSAARRRRRAGVRGTPSPRT
jgi:hypothetical protein